MNKPVRVVIAIVGVVVSLIAAFASDTYVRARRAFAAHERRVSEEFAVLRLRHVIAPHPAEGWKARYEEWLASLEFPTVPKESTDTLDLGYLNVSEIPKARHLVQCGTYFEYEDDSQNDLLSYLRWYGHSGSRWAPLPEATPEHVLRLLAVAQDVLRAGGVAQARRRLAVEIAAVDLWKRILEAHDLAPAKLAEIASSLDQIERARPPVQDALDAEFAMARQKVARVIRMRRNPGVVTSEPGWRELFSWHILLVQVMNEMDDDRRELAGFDSLSETQKKLLIHLAYPRKLARALIDEGYDLCAREAEAGVRWTLMRTATAVAWYEAEHGTYPEMVADLVPRYLGAVPKGMTHQSGFVYSDPLSPETSIWFVGRRGVPLR